MQMLFKGQHDEQEESHWLSVSDLMAGLMMVFLFIAVALMREAFVERDQIKQLAVAYQENQVAIFEALNKEFKKDLKTWDAEINEETLTFTF
ncbi:MAG: OmpA family protein, partial [Porticoccaceae bacterium]